MTWSLTIFWVFSTKKDANASGNSIELIWLLFKVIDFGSEGMLVSFAILTASHRDFVLPGRILRLTFFDFFAWKWHLISTFKFLIRSLNTFVFSNFNFLNSLFRRFILFLIIFGSLSELEVALFSKGVKGAILSIIGSRRFSKRFHEA